MFVKLQIAACKRERHSTRTSFIIAKREKHTNTHTPAQPDSGCCRERVKLDWHPSKQFSKRRRRKGEKRVGRLVNVQLMTRNARFIVFIAIIRKAFCYSYFIGEPLSKKIFAIWNEFIIFLFVDWKRKMAIPSISGSFRVSSCCFTGDLVSLRQWSFPDRTWDISSQVFRVFLRVSTSCGFLFKND